jgi:hypothetical protein
LIQNYSGKVDKKICEKWVVCDVEEYLRGEIEGDWTGVAILDFSDIPIQKRVIYRSNVFIVRTLR